MRLRIISIWAVLILAGLLPQLAKAQIAASNPLEWAALAEGNELINGQIDKQIKGQTQTALMQNSIAAEFNRIHEWEKQYNSYLKTASGYASSLKACTHLYNDGVRIFLTLEKLGKAIRNNPQGIVASMNMNNLYIETATELVSVFTSIFSSPNKSCVRCFQSSILAFLKPLIEPFAYLLVMLRLIVATRI